MEHFAYCAHLTPGCFSARNTFYSCDFLKRLKKRTRTLLIIRVRGTGREKVRFAAGAYWLIGNDKECMRRMKVMYLAVDQYEYATGQEIRPSPVTSATQIKFLARCAFIAFTEGDSSTSGTLGCMTFILF